MYRYCRAPLLPKQEDGHAALKSLEEDPAVFAHKQAEVNVSKREIETQPTSVSLRYSQNEDRSPMMQLRLTSLFRALMRVPHTGKS